MHSPLTALLLFASAGACSASRGDSTPPALEGWALEASGPLQHFMLAPGDQYDWQLAAASAGQACEGCSVEQDAAVELSLRLEPLSEHSGEVRLELGQASRTLQLEEDREVLLRSELFQGCSSAPSCVEMVPVRLQSEVALKGRWSAKAQATSTHNAPDWEPEAELKLELRQP